MSFYYYGPNTLDGNHEVFPGIVVIYEPFYRVEDDFRFKYRQFELYGLGMHGHDTNLIPSLTTFSLDCGTPVNFSGGFAEAEYWIYPWLIGVVRYEVVNSPTDFLNAVSRRNTRNRLGPGVQFLVRSNIKVAFEYRLWWGRSAGEADKFFRANGFATGTDYSF